VDNDVAATARTTASIRARETARADALFRDPLAEVLAGPEAMAAFGAMPEAVQARSSLYTIMRTRVFDDWLTSTTAAAAGLAQVVLLGAGFDSRAFRLDWRTGVALWELDQAALLAAKEAILAPSAPLPGCTRTTVAVDFADAEWPAALQAAGFRPELQTAWLAEGLFPYLTPHVAASVLDAAAALSATASQFAADLVDEDSVAARNQYLARLRELGPAVKGAPFQFGTNDPTQFLAAHGWSTLTIVEPADVAARFGRVIEEPELRITLPLPRLSFVMARRAL